MIKICNTPQFITIDGLVYKFPTAALIVDQKYFGAKFKLTPLHNTNKSMFADVELTDEQRVEARCIIEENLQQGVVSHENFVLTGNVLVHEGFNGMPKLTLQSMQVHKRLYAVNALPIVNKELLYIVCDQKIAVVVDKQGRIIDRNRLLPTDMPLSDLLNQLYNCSVSEQPLDVRYNKPGGYHTLLLPKMVSGWHNEIAWAIEQFVSHKTVVV